MAARKWTAAGAMKLWIEIVLVLGAVAWVLLVLWILVTPTIVDKGGADVNVTVAIGSHTFVPRMRLEIAAPEDGGTGEFDRASLVKGYGELRAVTRDWGLHFASMLPFIVWLPVLLYTFWVLRELLRTVLAGEPFAAANSRRLRRIGFILLAMTFLVPVVEYSVGRAVLERLSLEGIALSPAFRFSTDALFVALLFLVLSTVFRHGTELEEERSLTV